MSIQTRATIYVLLIMSVYLLIGFSIGKAYGHPGGLDSRGGHRQSSTGGYHFHEGIYDGVSFSSPLDAISFFAADWERAVQVSDGERFVKFHLEKQGIICVVAFEKNEEALSFLTGVESCRQLTFVDILNEQNRQRSLVHVERLDGFGDTPIQGISEVPR